MVNLITENNRRQVIGEYKKRRWVVAGSLALSLLVIGLVLLASFYAALFLKEKSLDSLLASSGADLINKSLNEIHQVAGQTNARVDLIITNTGAGLVPTDVLGQVFGLADDRIEIKSATMEVDGGEVIVDVSGVSSGRSDLVSYISRLENEEGVIQVDAPISNLIKDAGSNFEISIVLDNKN